MLKYYEFQNSAKILSGEFAIENISYEFKVLGAKNILVLTDKTLEKIGIVQIVIDGINEKIVNVSKIFSDIPQDSSINVIDKIVKIYKNLNCDGILAIRWRICYRHSKRCTYGFISRKRKCYGTYGM